MRPRQGWPPLIAWPGLEPPKTFVWLDSPLAGAIGAWVVADARDEVRDQVGADPWDGVETQVKDQVKGRAGHQAGDQVRDRVWSEVFGRSCPAC